MSGNITFQNNGGNISGCVLVVVSDNVATCTVSIALANNLPVGTNNVNVTALSSGNYTIPVSPTGTGNFGSCRSELTTLVSPPNPSLPGQSFTLTATVTVPAPGVVAPVR